jgi:hypothetical protein
VIDDIPTSVLKKGVEVLAGPISHLVNRLLAEGGVPEAFKVGKVFPIFKGKGKAPEDPASYRPGQSCQQCPRSWRPRSRRTCKITLPG